MASTESRSHRDSQGRERLQKEAAGASKHGDFLSRPSASNLAIPVPNAIQATEEARGGLQYACARGACHLAKGQVGGQEAWFMWLHTSLPVLTKLFFFSYLSQKRYLAQK